MFWFRMRCVAAVLLPISLQNLAVVWCALRAWLFCYDFNSVWRVRAHSLLNAGMWLSTRSQLEQFISSPFWNKTTALAADIRDSLGIAYGWGYPGNVRTLESLVLLAGLSACKFRTFLTAMGMKFDGNFAFVVHTRIICHDYLRERYVSVLHD